MFSNPQPPGTLRFVCISDTHNLAHKLTLPKGDVLIHSGDITKFGKEKEVIAFNNWFKKQRFKYRILVPGNHDFCLCPAKNPEDYLKSRELLSGANHVLYEESLEIQGIKLYGSPHNPAFHDMAFNKTDEELVELRKKIPYDVNILITHNPPKGIRDMIWNGDRVGEYSLLKAVRAIKPEYSIFGHIHESTGVSKIDGTTFINCAVSGLRGQDLKPPIVFDYKTK